MYEFRYINKQIEKTSTSYSLVLEDRTTGRPTVRIEKSFKVDSKLIDDEFLRSEAKKDIDRIVNEQDNVVIEEVDYGYISE